MLAPRSLTFFFLATELLLLLHLRVSLTVAEQCRTDFDNPCVAHCDNKTSLDISRLFQYPFNVTSGYIWSPCVGYQCPNSEGDNCAVCQHADQWYCCGLYNQPIWLLYSREPLEFQIEYPFGSQWRISIFLFKAVPGQEVTTVQFLNEQPGLQYNFLVEGRSIGLVSYKTEEGVDQL